METAAGGMKQRAGKSRFAGKVAVVTGAARGMGLACVEAFLAEGARVAAVDLCEDDLNALRRHCKPKPGQLLAMTGDVSIATQVEAVVRRTVKELGTVDILVNCAGVLRTTRPLEKIPEDEWDMVLNVNLKGCFLFSKAVLPFMRRQRHGKIVNISSSAGRSTSELGGAHYTVSKTGLLGLTRHTAREYGKYGISVNSICPGLVDTPMIREQAPPALLRYWRRQIPMGRFAEPEELAALVLFLASDEAAYVNGATIDFNGASLLL